MAKTKSKQKSIARALGAVELLSTQRLALYLPHKDKNGKNVKNIRSWTDHAAKLLALLGGGSTALPPSKVVWLRTSKAKTFEDVKASDLVRETTTVVYTYIDQNRLVQNLGKLREFLHQFGKEANQREVVIEFNNSFYKLENFYS